MGGYSLVLERRSQKRQLKEFGRSQSSLAHRGSGVLPEVSRPEIQCFCTSKMAGCTPTNIQNHANCQPKRIRSVHLLEKSMRNGGFLKQQQSSSPFSST